MSGMTSRQRSLFAAIESYQLDDLSTVYPFSRHLERENRWTKEYTQQAISEYQKFIFLASETNHPVTPSDAVDRVWHLHLLYSEDYWNSFCPHIVGKPLHHSPAKGGRHEREEFHYRYHQTLDRYYQFFGPPPRNIWPHPHRRFGRDLHVQAINVEEYWTVKNPLADVSRETIKPALPHIAIGAIIVLGSFISNTFF